MLLGNLKQIFHTNASQMSSCTKVAIFEEIQTAGQEIQESAEEEL